MHVLILTITFFTASYAAAHWLMPAPTQRTQALLCWHEVAAMQRVTPADCPQP